jgi:hypothetical protein
VILEFSIFQNYSLKKSSPANQLGRAISELKSEGFGIDNNQYSFTSLRSGGDSTEGADKHQCFWY